MMAADESGVVRIPIKSTNDVTRARKEGRALAKRVGLSIPRETLTATAITELAENILKHTHGGEIILATYGEHGRSGLSITAKDTGPGIPDIAQVTRNSLDSTMDQNCGLRGLRALADIFLMESTQGRGTSVLIVLLAG